MSSASSVGGAGQALYQMLHKTSGSHGGHHAKGAGGASGGGSCSGSSDTSGTDDSSSTSGDLFSQLESSITDALNSAPDGSDPNQTIEQAIENMLNGSSSSSSATSASSTTATTDADGAQDASGQVNSDTSNRQAFFQSLKDHGVDPKQFRQDLMTALQQSSSNGGQFDRSTAFASVPPGVAVDVAA